MKKALIILFIMFGLGVQAQNKNAKAVVEVDGVCMMCKQRIEKAAIKSKGVKSAVWNVKTHELSLIFDERKTTLAEIQGNVAAVGHDTPEVIATEEAYNSVHECCKYRSEEVKKDHNEKTDDNKN